MIFLSLSCSREKLKETSEIKNAFARLFDGWIGNTSCDETKSGQSDQQLKSYIEDFE